MLQIITVLVMAALVVIDQVIKYFVASSHAVGDVLFKIPGFVEIVYAENYGGMMGTFSNMAKVLGVIALIVIVVGFVLLMIKKIRFGFVYICITMILSGGIGNIIDRFRLGYVIDYINVLFVNFYVFNFADSLVTVGAILLIIYEIYELIKGAGKPGEKTGESDG